MAQYFDQTFFKFFFGFLLILVVSFTLLVVTNHWSERDNPNGANVSAETEQTDFTVTNQVE